MCVLNACCYCVFLNCGCFILGVILLVSRILLMALVLNDSTYKSIEITEDLTAGHISAILLIIGCIPTIILLCGVITSGPDLLKIFLVLEFLFFISWIVWEVYIAVNYQDEIEKGTKKGKDEEQLKIERVLHWVVPIFVIGFEVYTLWVVYSLHWFLRRPYYYYDDDEYIYM